MVHVPVVIPVTIFPDTVQTSRFMLVKVTGRVEVAIALTVVVPPTAKVVGLKLMTPMVWFKLLTVMDCSSSAAMIWLASPAWFAAIMQVPIVTSLTVLPLTVQTLGVLLLKVTALPDRIVALSVDVPR